MMAPPLQRQQVELRMRDEDVKVALRVQLHGGRASRSSTADFLGGVRAQAPVRQHVWSRQNSTTAT
ncbi:hypothetical protein V7S43_017244 [Phytophthora oleae]|uniref:Uncharacterized protein n=1 Tax=Phytophthora oleae TaxID=2107226 RepID=A0ABD3EX31_9STRA